MSPFDIFSPEERIRDIVFRDGAEDRLKDPPGPEPFTPNREWPGP